ncbi:serine/threonine-protein kinase [Nocardia sp. NPDC051030]|uniref:serine/threonine-protein kinase n=1 Tax=Nocardia sp. NPDC051030 TaxID=3155162 RepID=UPI00342E92EA
MNAADDRSYGGYRIERKLGSGGMGAVYLAQHPRLPRKDALKVLSDSHQDDPGFRARFLREAEIAAQLQHPNLVAVRDRGEQDGRLWIAMQYVEGIDGAELLRHGPLDPARAVRIISEAAHGLDEVHRAGLLHRDVKPANILIATPTDGLERVLVTDFGIARPADDSATLDGAGGLTATLAYAAPEQLNGEPVDHRTDVYALGCTLYQMLTGSVPFPLDSPAAIMFAHLNSPPPRPSALNPALPIEFDAVIATALAKNPADRFQSCGVLAAAAQGAFLGAVHRPRPKRRALVATALTAVLIAVASGISLAAFNSGDDTPSADPHRPNTTGVDPASWGEYAYIVQLFPALYPPAPNAVGYQQITNCSPIPEHGDNTLTFDDKPAVGVLFCLGDRDPVYTVETKCNANRTAIVPDNALFEKLEGDEAWSRPTGSGHLFWGTTTYPADNFLPILAGKKMGILEVMFADASRNFCRLTVTGATTGAAIHDRWWPQAPL